MDDELTGLTVDLHEAAESISNLAGTLEIDETNKAKIKQSLKLLEVAYDLLREAQ